jgi:hypothetical protein
MPGISRGIFANSFQKERIYHPGLFTVFAYRAALHKKRGSEMGRQPAVITDYAASFELLYMSSLMQDGVLERLSGIDPDSDAFESLLSQLEYVSCGLSGIGTSNLSSLERSGEIINLLGRLCESEIRSLHGKMAVLGACGTPRKTAMSRAQTFEGYYNATASRLLKYSMLAGAHLSGEQTPHGRSEASLDSAGDHLSLSFGIWSDAVKASNAIKGERRRVFILDIIPLSMVSGQKIESLAADGMFLDRTRIPRGLQSRSTFRRIDGIAEKYYKKGSRLLESAYGDSAKWLLEYSDMCRRAIRKDAGYED